VDDLSDETRALIDDCRSRVIATGDQDLRAYLEKIERGPVRPALLYLSARNALKCGYSPLSRYLVDVAGSLPHKSWEDICLRGEEARLRISDWRGWADREARLFDPTESIVRLQRFRDLRWSEWQWDGSDLTGKRILALADGGFGDCIMTLRYVSVLAQMADAVTIAVRPECFSLAQHNCAPYATVVLRDLPSPTTHDCFTLCMSLPALIGSLPRFTPLSAPNSTNYPHTETHRLRVGLCWAGRTNYPGNRPGRFSSLSLADLSPLLARDDVEWHVLQTGKWEADAAAYPDLLRVPDPSLTFADTANRIVALDCVITVDTSTAHLAGALGVPTLLLLRFKSEFRWGSAETTPWYPSMRLLRQPTPGDWKSVVDAAMTVLDDASWIDCRGATLAR
jgi:hypothetical protein